MGSVANQPPIYIGPGTDHAQELAFINQNFTLLNNQLQQFGYRDSVTVTRPGSVNSQSADIATGIFNAPVFTCFATVPGSSPAFIKPVPDTGYDVTTGAVTTQLRALYDPTTSVIRCFVESSDVDPNFATPAIWTFTYTLVKPTSG